VKSSTSITLNSTPQNTDNNSLTISFGIGTFPLKLHYGGNKKVQLTQRECATAVHVWRPTANKCKILKNLYFSAQGHSRL